MTFLSLEPSIWLLLLLLGCMTGYLAGLLGVGGGMVLVPFLTLLFSHLGLGLAVSGASYAVHMAVATSLTTILFTSISSVRAHHKRGAVRWDLVTIMAIPAIIGTILGAQLSAHIKPAWLAALFAVIVGQSAIKIQG